MRPKTNGPSGETRREEAGPLEDPVRSVHGRSKESQQKQIQEVRSLHLGKGRFSGRARIDISYNWKKICDIPCGCQ